MACCGTSWNAGCNVRSCISLIFSIMSLNIMSLCYLAGWRATYWGLISCRFLFRFLGDFKRIFFFTLPQEWWSGNRLEVAHNSTNLRPLLSSLDPLRRYKVAPLKLLHKVTWVSGTLSFQLMNSYDLLRIDLFQIPVSSLAFFVRFLSLNWKDYIRHKYALEGYFVVMRLREIRPLASTCLSVCPSAWNSSAPIGSVFMGFDI